MMGLGAKPKKGQYWWVDALYTYASPSVGFPTVVEVVDARSSWSVGVKKVGDDDYLRTYCPRQVFYNEGSHRVYKKDLPFYLMRTM